MKALKRYMTVEEYSGEITAYHESEAHNALEKHPDWAEYIWQFADSKHAAITKHYEKFDIYQSEINAGKPERDTY